MQRTVKAAWTPPSFYSSSNNSPVSLASASNRSDKRVLAKHCQCFDHAALGLGKKAWSNKVSLFDSPPGSNIWDLVCHQSRTACEGPGHFKKPQLEVAEECWRHRNARWGRSREWSDCFPFVFERMGSHVSGKLHAVYFLKQSALLSLRVLTWMRNIVTEQLDKGHFTLFQSSVFCILFHCDCPTKCKRWQRWKGSRCTSETGQHINSLIDRRLLRG